MNDQIDYIGPYRMKSEEFLYSTITLNGNRYRVADAIGATDDGRNIARLMPNVASNSELVNLVQDGDLLGYIRAPMNINITLPCGLNTKVDENCSSGNIPARDDGHRPRGLHRCRYTRSDRRKVYRSLACGYVTSIRLQTELRAMVNSRVFSRRLLPAFARNAIRQRLACRLRA